MDAVKDYLEDLTQFTTDIAKDNNVSIQTLRNWVKEFTEWTA